MEKPVEDLRRRPETVLMAKLWERLGIEEDPEPMWYVLNCVAGLEIDLLRQSRQRCEDMEDVEKFVVPMLTTTRSHGAKRMVQDTKVKYQGYVCKSNYGRNIFLLAGSRPRNSSSPSLAVTKLRLCAETYEAVQGMYIDITERKFEGRSPFRK
jgi:hypothetical protein